MNATGYPVVNEKITVTSIVSRVNAQTSNGQPRLIWQVLEDVTNVHVDFTVLSDEAQLPVFLAAGEWPDFFNDDLTQSYVNEYGIQGGMFVDYNSLMDFMPNLEKMFNEQPQTKKGKTEINGAIYQLPYYYDVVTATESRNYYRADILEKYNLPVPTTVDELYDVCKKLLDITGEPPFSGDWIPEFYYPSFGPGCWLGFDDEKGDGKVVWGRMTDQYKYYLTYINKLYTEGLIHREYLTMDTATLLALAQEGKSVFTGHAMGNVTLAAFPSGKFDIGVMPPLKSEYDDTQVIWTGPPPWGGGRGKAINTKSKYAAEIARMLDVAFATEEVLPGTGLYGSAFTWGQEGVGWEFTNAEKTSHRQIIPEEYGDMTYLTYQGEYVIYQNFGYDIALRRSIVNDGSNSEARQIGFRDHNLPYERGWQFPPVKFNEEEQAVLDSYMVEINNYVNEMMSKFITGIADIDAEWDTYIATLEKMGAAEVLAVYQAAYDRWNAL